MNGENNKANTSQILIVVACFVVVIAGMTLAKDILVPFLLAIFISIIASPPLFWLKGKGLPTWLSLIIVILGVLLIILLIGWLIGSSIASFTEDLPVYEAKLKQYTASITNWLERLGLDTSGLSLTEIFNPGAAMKLVGSLLSNLGSMLSNGFLIMMTVLFILLEASGFPAKLRAAFSDSESPLVQFDSFINNVKQYMTIKTWISLATGLLVTIWLAILGVDYALLWGLLAFALNYVPNIGSIIAAVPAVLLALIQLGFWRAIAVAVGYLVINLLMGSVIEPRFMGRGLGLSTLVVFLSLIFWGWVLGPVGMLLSVPLTMTAKIALDSREDTRWIAVLLGPHIPPSKPRIKKQKDP